MLMVVKNQPGELIATQQQNVCSPRQRKQQERWEKEIKQYIF